MNLHRRRKSDKEIMCVYVCVYMCEMTLFSTTSSSRCRVMRPIEIFSPVDIHTGCPWPTRRLPFNDRLLRQRSEKKHLLTISRESAFLSERRLKWVIQDIIIDFYAIIVYRVGNYTSVRYVIKIQYKSGWLKSVNFFLLKNRSY